jgi:DNA repair protein RecN (Recombination protein N)
MTENDNQNVITLLKNMHKTLEMIHLLEPKASAWIHTLDSILIELSNLESELSNYLGNTELDLDKLHTIEERISLIFNLARKHKISPPELIELREKFTAELNALETSDEDLTKLEEKQQILAKEYDVLAEKLSQSRQMAATKLETEINAIIRSLSLPHAEFSIELKKDLLPFANNGIDKIIFLIKTNPDLPSQPLAKVISGGELSRLSLALHLSLANKTTIPTLVFDEVDTGLSGATAEKIGKLLRKLGDSYQVFCITHQPQVAACGHHHLLVEKYFVAESTHSRLRLLNTEEKTREIARMLAGEKITQKTYEHAEELLQLFI